MSALKWDDALIAVARGRKPQALAAVVGVAPQTVRRWLRGERVPSAAMWRALVVEAGLGERWPEFSAARDAAERKPTGRPRLPKAVRLARLNKQIEEVQCE